MWKRSRKRAGNRWAADRHVFVNDAAVLLEQGAGRIIRSMSDSGLVAVFDPRRLKVGPFQSPHATRNVYLSALHRFDRRFSQLDKATGSSRSVGALDRTGTNASKNPR